MKRESCPACGGRQVLTEAHAWVSPWVRELSGFPERQTRFRVCAICGTGFFVDVPDETQLALLYQGYRGERYQQVRHRWEPTYTEDFNRQLNSGADFMNARRKAMQDFLQLTVPGLSSTCQGVVDVGGGEGHLMPAWPSIRHRYVLDISGAPTNPGVTRIQSASEVKASRIDLVQLCGVLEHVGDPESFLRDSLEPFARLTETLVVLVEVPAGVPQARGRLVSAFPAFELVTRSTGLWRLANRIDAGAGPLRKHWPLRMGEHLTFFSQSGLKSLLQRVGIEVQGIEEVEIVGLDSGVTVRFSHGLVASGFISAN